MNLAEYVVNHTERNACRCGKCIDSGEDRQLQGHTVNMYFFDVSACNNPTPEEFVKLTKAHRGEFGDVDPLDGKEHSYMELGGWIGDQGLAMQYMALGQLLGLWRTMTPAAILNVNDPQQKAVADIMAGSGLVSIMPRPAAVADATVITPQGENKAFAFDPKTGESKVYDFDKPDKDMLRQMAEVLIHRLDNPAVLRMLYLDNDKVPPEICTIVQDLVDAKIDKSDATRRIEEWKAKL